MLAGFDFYGGVTMMCAWGGAGRTWGGILMGRKEEDLPPLVDHYLSRVAHVASMLSNRSSLIGRVHEIDVGHHACVLLDLTTPQ